MFILYKQSHCANSNRFFHPLTYIPEHWIAPEICTIKALNAFLCFCWKEKHAHSFIKQAARFLEVIWFPSHKYATPQWYKIVSHASCTILEDVTEPGYTPIVQMIDNFERNHKLGILFEGKAGNGKLLICTSRLSEISSYPEIKQFIKSITDYVASDSFNPEMELDLEKLKKLF